MKKSVSTLLLLLSFYLTQAQDYLVTPQRDTLYGEIQILLPSEYYEEITLETDEGSRKYRAHEFVSLLDDNATYKPVKLGDKYKIMRLESSGYLSLLSYRIDDNYDFGSKYLLKNTGQGIELPTIMFKKAMIEFLEDCDRVAKKIESKTYKRGNLEKIISDYNGCIDNQTRALYDEVPAQPKRDILTKKSKANEIINSIQNKLNTSNEYSNDLKALLSDIDEKLMAHIKVPAYMIGALKEQTTGMASIEEEIKELLPLLNNQQ